MQRSEEEHGSGQCVWVSRQPSRYKTRRSTLPESSLSERTRSNTNVLSVSRSSAWSEGPVLVLSFMASARGGWRRTGGREGIKVKVVDLDETHHRAEVWKSMFDVLGGETTLSLIDDDCSVSYYIPLSRATMSSAVRGSDHDVVSPMQRNIP